MRVDEIPAGHPAEMLLLSRVLADQALTALIETDGGSGNRATSAHWAAVRAFEEAYEEYTAERDAYLLLNGDDAWTPGGPAIF